MPSAKKGKNEAIPIKDISWVNIQLTCVEEVLINTGTSITPENMFLLVISCISANSKVVMILLTLSCFPMIADT